MRLLPHGTKIGNATVIVDIVKKGNPEIRPGTPMKPTALTDHDTGNPGRGADAKAHNRLLHNWGNLPVRDTSHVSWHITVDENFIIQHLPFDECAYHCGDGWGVNSGNRTSVGVEKCMHQGANREAIESNAIALYVFLMKELRIPVTRIFPHQHWSGKYCPQLILNKYGSFKPFRDRIELANKGGTNVVNEAHGTLRLGSQGTSVRYLQSVLNRNGHTLDLDGRFGPATDKAVREYQAKNGLVVDGVVGSATWSSLEKPPVVSATPSPAPVSELSPTLKTDVERAIHFGISNGGNFKGQATREEVLAMFGRFIKQIQDGNIK